MKKEPSRLLIAAGYIGMFLVTILLASLRPYTAFLVIVGFIWLALIVVMIFGSPREQKKPKGWFGSPR